MDKKDRIDAIVGITAAVLLIVLILALICILVFGSPVFADNYYFETLIVNDTGEGREYFRTTKLELDNGVVAFNALYNTSVDTKIIGITLDDTQLTNVLDAGYDTMTCEEVLTRADELRLAAYNACFGIDPVE